MLKSLRQFGRLRSLLGGTRKRAAARRLVSAVLETLEERRLLAGLVDYVVHISMDGLRPDVILPSHTNFQRLKTEGAWTDNARNDYDMYDTLPNHVTMLTALPKVEGVDDEGNPYRGHQWPFNDELQFTTAVTIHSNHTPQPTYIPSVYDVVHDNHLRTSMYAGKTKFRLFRDSYDSETTQWQGGAEDTVVPPIDGRNKIDFWQQPVELPWLCDSWSELNKDADVDGWLHIMRGKYAGQAPFNYSFFNFRDPDKAGHSKGWGSAGYGHAVDHVDAYLGAIFDLIDHDSRYTGHTAVIVTADHGGGADGSTEHNNTSSPLVYTVPFFVWGPGIIGNGEFGSSRGNLYAMNSSTRTWPSGRMPNTTVRQPIRHGDSANLALELLGLPAIPGSYFNKKQDLSFGTLKVTGTPGNDVIAITVNGSGLEVTVGGVMTPYSLADYAAIRVDALGGDDSVSISESITLMTVLNGGDGNDSLTGGSGDDRLDGGAGSDTLRGCGGNDTAYYYQHTTDLRLTLDNANNDSDGTAGGSAEDVGSDIETVIGGTGNDFVDASFGKAANFLAGNDGNDTLRGGDGNDTLDGGKGCDVLRGDAGFDTADYSRWATGNLNITLDGLANDSDGSTGTLANENVWPDIETIIGGAGADTIDATSCFDPVQLEGGYGADKLTGGSANDTFVGGGGNDTLVAGGGIDTADYSSSPAAVTIYIEAQGGNDGYGGQDSLSGVESVVGSTYDDVIRPSSNPDYIDGGAGIDTLDYYANTAAHPVHVRLVYHRTEDDGYGNIDQLSGIENVWGTDGNDSLLGDFGDNVLRGYNGNDTIDGCTDFYTGIATNDTADFSYNLNTIHVTAQTANGDLQTPAYEKDGANNIIYTKQLLRIRSLWGGAGNDKLTGDRYDNILRGNLGNDTLNGGSGGSDTADYSNATGTVTATCALLVFTTSSGAAGADQLMRISNLWGSAYNDTLTGSTKDNILRGNAGSDSLSGVGGFDTADFSTTTYNVTASAVGIATTSSATEKGTEKNADGVLLTVFTKTLRGITNLIGGSGNDSLTGDTTANKLTGNAGNDTLVGSSGNDSLLGGDGNDQLQGGTGSDSLDGNAGVNTADFSDIPSTVTATATGSSSTTAVNGTDTDTLRNIRNLWGGTNKDTLTGDANDNILRGNGGDDSLDGGAGGSDTADYSTATTAVTATCAADTPTTSSGGGGADSLVRIRNLIGGSLGDTLNGDANPNVLTGNAGTDKLVGKDGNDTLYGGADSDTADYSAVTVAINASLLRGTLTYSTYANSLYGVENVTGGTGNDTIVGDDCANTLSGGSGNDGLNGLGAADSLAGDNNDDTLLGGPGNDTLAGGSGSDTADYSTSTAAVNVSLQTGVGYDGMKSDTTPGGTGNDSVTSDIENLVGSPYDDVLAGRNAVLNALNGGDGNDTADYFSATSAIDASLARGDAKEGAFVTDTFLNIENLWGSSQADTLAGDSGNNLLRGGASKDSYTSNGGVDTLDFSTSAATVTASTTTVTTDGKGSTNETVAGTFLNLIGGSVNDSLTGDAGNNVLRGNGGQDTYTSNGGIDTLDFSTSIGNVTATPTSVAADGNGSINEIVYGTFVNLTGGSGNDNLTGNASDNKLVGGPGQDILAPGGGGNDILYGGSNVDTLTFAAISSAVTASLKAGTASYSTYKLEISGFESLIGGSGADVLTGDDAANTINGGAGNDKLDGLAGNDSLVGGNDNDSLIGGAGTDTLDGGTHGAGAGSGDAAEYSTSLWGVTVSLKDSAASNDGFGFTDSLTAIENLTGSPYDDVLAGRNAVLNILNGGDGNDTADYFSSTSAIDASLARGDAKESTFVTDTFLSIENLWGSPQADTLAGDSGNNLLRGGASKDSYTSNGGVDTLDFSTSAATVTASTTTVTTDGTGSTNETVAGTFLNLIGGSVNDSLTGDAGNNVLRGNGGQDTYTSNGGIDTLDFSTSTGNVTATPTSVAADGNGGTNEIVNGTFVNLTGGSGNDTLKGNANANGLTGGAGDDLLIGMGGADTLAGGDGTDTASYDDPSTGAVQATVNSGTASGMDGFSSTDTFTSIENLVGGPQGDTLTGDSQANFIYGLAGADELYGAAANDFIDGGVGNDLIYGDAGNDWLNGGDDADDVDGGDGNDSLIGGMGDDNLIGGSSPSDSDTAWYNISGSGDVTATANSGTDTGMDGFGATDTFTNVDNITGGPGNDMLNGDDEANTINGMNGSDTIYAGNGADLADGGFGRNYVYGQEGNDTVSCGDGGGWVFGDGWGTSGDDLVYGGASHDACYGGYGNDTIYGGGGDDCMMGGSWGGSGDWMIYSYDGSDVLIGGSGSDRYFWNGTWQGDDTATELASDSGRDDLGFYNYSNSIVLDLRLTTRQYFSSGTSLLITNLCSIEAIGGTAYCDTLYGDDRDNYLRAGDGTGTQEVYGFAGNDSLYASGSLDSIDAGEGDDYLSTAYGTDTLKGGPGNDLYGFYSVGIAQIIEDPNADSDTLTFSYHPVALKLWDTQLQTVSSGFQMQLSNDSAIENVTTSWDSFWAYTDNIEGNSRNNLICTEHGNDTIKGLAGNDTLVGGDGNDSLVGGDGSDEYWIVGSVSGDDTVEETLGGSDVDVLDFYEFTGGPVQNDGVVVKLWELHRQVLPPNPPGTNAITILNAPDNPAGTGPVENLIGTALYDDLLEGDAGNNLIVSGSPNTTILGYDGNDTLIGSAWYDSLDGGNGNDYVFGGEGDDVIVGGAGADTLDGSGGNDTLDGGSGNDSVFGSDGDDVLSGGSGNDTIDGGAGNDLVNYSTSTAAVNISLLSGSGTDGMSGTDTISNIENLTGSAYNDTLVGNSGANVIRGGAGNDYMYGGAGDDYMDGEAGNDYVSGEDGNDTLVGGTGSDSLYGGYGSDWADYSASTAAVNISLQSGSGTDGMGGTDTLSGVENLTGSPYNDTLVGDTYANTIRGGAGNDYIYGGYGDDYLYGEDGNDYVSGDDGNDWLFGGAGNDSSYGGNGADYMYGGSGNDYLNGGSGSDYMNGETGADSFYAYDGYYDYVDAGIDNDVDSILGSDYLDVFYNFP